MCGSGGPAWKSRPATAKAEHRERDQGACRVEAEGSPGEQPDACVDRLHERVGEPVLERDQDGVEVVGNGVAEPHEGIQARAPGPLQPLLQELDRLLQRELEDRAQLLLEKVGAEQRLVDASDPAQLALLPGAEVLGVLPERPARALELASMGVVTAVAGLVPDLTSNLVEGPGGPGHGVEGIEADDRVRAGAANHVGDPGGAVGADVGDAQAAATAEGQEEAGQGGLVAALGGPDQATPLVVDHHRQIALALAEGDLIDAQPTQSGELEVGPVQPPGDPLQDASHRAPGDPHQHGHGRLRALHCQPGDLVLEGPCEPAAGRGPGHVLDHHPVLGAAHAPDLGLHIGAERAEIERPPAPASARPVVPRADPPAVPAAAAALPAGEHLDEQPVIFQLDRLDPDGTQTEQASPYPGIAHAVPPYETRSSDNRDRIRDGVRARSGQVSTNPHIGQETPFFDTGVHRFRQVMRRSWTAFSQSVLLRPWASIASWGTKTTTRSSMATKRSA